MTARIAAVKVAYQGLVARLVALDTRLVAISASEDRKRTAAARAT